jgi:hypothetical protein
MSIFRLSLAYRIPEHQVAEGTIGPPLCACWYVNHYTPVALLQDSQADYAHALYALINCVTRVLVICRCAQTQVELSVIENMLLKIEYLLCAMPSQLDYTG